MGNERESETKKRDKNNRGTGGKRSKEAIKFYLLLSSLTLSKTHILSDEPFTSTDLSPLLCVVPYTFCFDVVSKRNMLPQFLANLRR